MIIFFGVRPGKTKEVPLKGVRCPNCDHSGHLYLFSTPSFIHIFWIPVWRLNTTRIAECNYCKRGFYKEDFTPEMQQAIPS